jgi:hypothetical protein
VLVAILLIGALRRGCIVTAADPAPASTDYHNSTGLLVTVYPDGHQYPGSSFQLAPEAAHSQEARASRLEVDDAEGRLIYCRVLTRSDWGDQQAWDGAIQDHPLRLSIDIQPGQLTCPAPSPSAPARQ